LSNNSNEINKPNTFTEKDLIGQQTVHGITISRIYGWSAHLENKRKKDEELIWKQLEFLENKSNEIDSFYDFDKTVKEIDDDIQSLDSNEGIESIESIQSIEGMNGMQNQIPLEKITPVMLLLGAGIVFYLFGSGKFDKK